MNISYETGKDLDNSDKNSGHTDVGYVGFLEDHNKPQMSRRVRSVNLIVKHMLLTAQRSHNRQIYCQMIDMKTQCMD